jgi:hypothetical protein
LEAEKYLAELEDEGHAEPTELALKPSNLKAPGYLENPLL